MEPPRSGAVSTNSLPPRSSERATTQGTSAESASSVCQLRSARHWRAGETERFQRKGCRDAAASAMDAAVAVVVARGNGRATCITSWTLEATEVPSTELVDSVVGRGGWLSRLPSPLPAVSALLMTVCILPSLPWSPTVALVVVAVMRSMGSSCCLVCARSHCTEVNKTQTNTLVLMAKQLHLSTHLRRYQISGTDAAGGCKDDTRGDSGGRAGDAIGLYV